MIGKIDKNTRVLAVVGSGGKTSLIHRLAEDARQQGKKVFVTTSTHMYIESDTLLSDDPELLIQRIRTEGYVMAGQAVGEKIKALSYDTYKKVCDEADLVLIEADGSRQMPFKFPNETEPVIYQNVDEILVVCGLWASGKMVRESTFRSELVMNVLNISEDTRMQPEHIQKLIRKGYIENMQQKYPDKKITIVPSHDGTLYQRVLASLISAELDVSLVKKEWFSEKPCLFICGAGHVAKELAEFAARLDFRVKVMDDRIEFANAERFPMAEEIFCESFEHLKDHLEEDYFYVVVSRGHKDDRQCVSQILSTQYRYLGMIGSKIKVAKTMELLKEEWKDKASEENIEKMLSTIHAPIGLKIGAATPGEIAISILAEMIQEKNKRSNASISSELLNTNLHGTLCIIIDKTGSSPRGVGSMMLVTENGILDSIGGGAVESAAIEEAKKCTSAKIIEYHLNDKDSERLGMICGGTNKILFVPV